MEVEVTGAAADQIDCTAVIVGVFDDGGLTPAAAAVDAAAGGLVRRLHERGEWRGKPNEITTLFEPAGVRAPVVVLVGLGKGPQIDAATAFRSAAASARHLSLKKRGPVACYLAQSASDTRTDYAVAGMLVGVTGADFRRAEPKRHTFERLVCGGAAEAAVARGAIVGESINLARRLVNEPPSELYPETFAARAVETAQAAGMSCDIWDEARLEAERCGSLLAVARGSLRPPRLVIVEHRGGKPDEAPIALVGKGVTFDSGGLSLKPTDSMTTMKCDMAGAAAVLATMQAAARLKLPRNLIGLMGLVENMPSGSAMKLGDVLTARSGKTIEVLNTDAEGRLVLADVLNVALDRKPAKIVDLATLTGACVVALGTDTAGAFANDQPWCDSVLSAARAAGEPLWQLPMFPEYGEQIRTEIADIKNTGDGRWGGAITAAKFLEEFVGGVPWVHLDIAGPAYFDKPKPWHDVGGTGAMVRTLIELLS